MCASVAFVYAQQQQQQLLLKAVQNCIDSPPENCEKKKRVEKKRKPAHFSPKRSKPAHFCYPHFLRKRLIPQIRVRMQANDNNRNKYVTLEGLAKLCEENPFQCAIMCRNVDEMGVVEICNKNMLRLRALNSYIPHHVFLENS